MKNSIFIVHLFLVLLFCACDKHYEMLTQINPDGSCIRQFQLRTNDTAFLAGDTSFNPFPVRLDTAWRVSVYDSVNGAWQPWPLQHLKSPVRASAVIATHPYASVEDMSRNFRFDHGSWKNIKPEITWKKSFRWFYTYYTFSEKYTRYPPQELPVPLEEYLTPEEQIQWFQGDPAAYRGMNGNEIYDYLEQLQEKAESWGKKSLFILQYSVIQDFLASGSDNPWSGRLSQARDSIFTIYKENYSFWSDHLASLLDQYFRTAYFSEAYRKNQRVLDSLSDVKSAVLELFDSHIQYELVMPGKVISTNAPHSENGKLIWQLNAYRFLPADYILQAESRRLNLWAVLVTLLFLGGVVYLFRHSI